MANRPRNNPLELMLRGVVVLNPGPANVMKVGLSAVAGFCARRIITVATTVIKVTAEAVLTLLNFMTVS